MAENIQILDLINEGEKLNEDETDLSFECFVKAYELCMDLSNSELKAKCLFLIGKTYSKTKNSNDNKRIEYLDKSIEIYEQLNLTDKLEYAMCYFYKSSCLQWLGKYTESTLNIDKCLELLGKMNMDICKEKADCLGEKCYNFFKIKLYLNSVETGRSALDVYKKADLGTCFDAGRCLRHMAESSGYLGVSSDFVNYYKQALDIFRSNPKPNSHKLIPFSLKKLSAAYGKNGQRDKQLKCALEALKSYQNPLVIDEWKDTEEMANTYVYLADAYRANCNLLSENYDFAKEYYDLALKFYKNNDNKNLYTNEIRKIRQKISSMRRGLNNSRVDDLVFSIRRLNF